MPALTVDELNSLIRDGVPLIGAMGVTVDSLGAGIIRLHLPYRGDFVRPGGTVMWDRRCSRWPTWRSMARCSA